MKKILGFLFNRTLLGALGILAIALIIWFVGPLLAIADYRPLAGSLIRWLLIALLIIFYVGKFLWKFIKAKRANAKLMEGLAKPVGAQAASSAGSEEVATLAKRFEEAVAVLKQTRLGGDKKSGLRGLFGGQWFGGQHIYELPWYIFIGAPGSGKTTALINSGLQFPLAEKFGMEAIRGVGGTRNCDWWFTDEAVLLDTAGRYTTQESNQQVDSAAWTGFLKLLKEYRPRRPINGALLTVSVADLLQQSPAQREAQASAMRQRIAELHEQLNIRFPIYVLVTKTDLLAGFNEFFNDYGKEERTQVWGFTFPLQETASASSPLTQFKEEFAALENRLNVRLPDRLQQERDPQKRALLYAFPQQFAAINDVLNEFLNSVFQPSRFQTPPLLRGVYLTSGTQEGNPIDRVLGGLARALKLERKLIQPLQPSGKSYFLTRLVRDVIFKEADLAGTNLKWERRRNTLQWGGIALALTITLAAAAAWSISYARNKAYISTVQNKIAATSQQVDALQALDSADVVSLLPILQSVQELSTTAEVTSEHAPWSMGFGLYQGDKLAAASTNTYHRLLQDSFLPRIALGIELLLRTSSDRPELLYEALKAYLMLGDAEHFNAPALKTFISATWDESLPREVTTEQRTALQNHLDVLLDRGQMNSPIVPDAQLISTSRNAIALTPIERRIYNRIRREGIGSQFPNFTIAETVGANAGLVFRRASGQPLTQGVPGLFSYKGYYEGFVGAAEKTTQQLADEQGWVLGLDAEQRKQFSDADSKKQLLNNARRLYLEDYANSWESFVKDIRIVSSTDSRQTIQTASILSSGTSPLPVLLRAIVHEVTLVKKADADKNLVEKGEDQLKQRTDQLKKLFGNDRPATQLDVAARPEAIVDNRFDDLRRLVTPVAPGQPAPIDSQIALLKDISQAMVTASAAIDANMPPPPSDAPNKAKLEASQSPEPLRTILLTLGDSAAQMIGLGAKVNASGELAQLADFCKKAIAGRYPFQRGSALDVTQDDFARLFAPGGEFDRFFQAKLLPIVDISRHPWGYRQVGDTRQSDSSGALLQFERAQAIRDVFFRGGGSMPSLRLEFKPTEMDASITQFILDIDGQLVKYSHGPQVSQPIQWPGPKGGNQVRIQVSPMSANSGLEFQGPWALFRLLDGAQFTPTAQPEKFSVTFNVGGSKAQFDVTSSSVQNPFKLKELQQFQCPMRL